MDWNGAIALVLFFVVVWLGLVRVGFTVYDWIDRRRRRREGGE